MRVKTAVPRHKRRRRLMKTVSGMVGTPKNRLRRAKDAAQRSMNYRFDGRKMRKRDFRSLWFALECERKGTTHLRLSILAGFLIQSFSEEVCLLHHEAAVQRGASRYGVLPRIPLGTAYGRAVR